MKLQVFDVEHGGCALLTCDNGSRMMIDCGHNATTGWYPGDHLLSVGVRHLNMLVVTNYDQDHVSGYPNLADSVTIGNIVRNTSVTPADIWKLKSEDGIASAAMGRFIQSIGFDFGPPGVGPAPQFPGVRWSPHWNVYPSFDDENNLSLVLRLVIGDVSFLFPGDMEYEGWRHLLATDTYFASLVASTTVLMASHHGRANGICPEMFDQFRCNPELVVISDDYHQYASQDTTEYYRSKCRGMDNFRGQERRYVLTTRSDGTLTFEWNGPKCFVS